MKREAYENKIKILVVHGKDDTWQTPTLSRLTQWETPLLLSLYLLAIFKTFRFFNTFK
jgi:hypothetical protein